MARFENCKAIIKSASGKDLSDKEAADLFTQLGEAAARRAGPTGSLADAGRMLAQEFAASARAAAEQEVRAAAINARLKDALNARTDTKNLVDSARSIVDPVNKTGMYKADTLWSRMGGAGEYAWGPFVAWARKEGVLPALLRRTEAEELALAKDLAHHSSGGKLEASGNSLTLRVAEQLHLAQEAVRARLNAAGAWIGKLDSYIVRQSHDMIKVRGDDRSWLDHLRGVKYDATAAFQRWHDYIMPRLDERTFDTVLGDRAAWMRSVWDALSTGMHETTNGADWLKGFTGSENIAKKLSQERSLHFKDPTAWYEYNAKYGRGSVLDAALRGLEHGTKNAVLMETLGTNPRAMYLGYVKRLAEQARASGDMAAADALRSSKFERLFDIIDGSAFTPDSAGMTLAAVGKSVRTWNNMVMLGATFMKSLPDIESKARVAQHHGIGFFESLDARGMANGLGAAPDSVTRAIADTQCAGLEGMQRALFRYIGGQDGVPGALARGADLLWTISGMTKWDSMHREGIAAMISHGMGKNVDRPFAMLDRLHQQTLERGGIGAAEWEAIRHAELAIDEGGRAHLVYDSVLDLPAEHIDPLIQKDLDSIDAHYGERQAKAADADAREAGWVAGRTEKFQKEHDAAVARLEELRTRPLSPARAAEIARLKGLVDHTQAQMDAAAAHAELLKAQRSAATKEYLADIIRGVEAGELTTEQIAKKTEWSAKVTEGRMFTLGKEYGARIKAAEQRVKELEAKIKELGAEPRQSSEEARAFQEKWKTRSDELTAFIEEMKERATKRAMALEDLESRIEPMKERARDRARLELQTKLRGLQFDQVSEALSMSTPGVQSLGTAVKAGTWTGEAARCFMQFKSYPLTFFSRSVMREVGRDGVNIGGLAQLIVGTTLLGYLSNNLNNVSKGIAWQGAESGRDLGSQFASALITGGGGGLWADFLLGEYNRFGGGVISTFAGPTAGQIDSLAAIFGMIKKGELSEGNRWTGADAEMKAMGFLRHNIPGANLWYARAALNHLVFHGLMENINPGYLRRMKQRTEREQHQNYWLDPTNAVRY